jgi:hypothetical protein
LSGRSSIGWPRNAATTSTAAKAFEQSGASRYSSPASMPCATAILDVSEDPSSA